MLGVHSTGGLSMLKTKLQLKAAGLCWYVRPPCRDKPLKGLTLTCKCKFFNYLIKFNLLC